MLDGMEEGSKWLAADGKDKACIYQYLLGVLVEAGVGW